MRGLWKIGLVVGILAAFTWATKEIAERSLKSDRATVVEGVIVPTRDHLRNLPLRLRVALYPGRPRRPTDNDVAIDELELNTEDTRRAFELEAGDGDGETFFVFAMVEPATFDRYCTSLALPRMRLVVDGDDRRWVSVRDGRALASLRVTPTTPCGTG